MPAVSVISIAIIMAQNDPIKRWTLNHDNTQFV